MRDRLEHLRANAPLLSVGVLSADLLRLGEELETVSRAGIELLHFDVMDGVFCPGLTAGAGLVRAVPSTFVKDVHLMVNDPLENVHSYVEAGASIITFHPEATRHPHRVLQSLRNTGVVRGIALNPGTPVESIEPLLDELELVLVLAVNPGWSGQQFASSTERKVRACRDLGGPDLLVAVDGGITGSNIAEVAMLRADIVVSGSAVFAGDVTENARAFMRALRPGGASDASRQLVG
jgi:ribulose-phosphate 3-epimerase